MPYADPQMQKKSERRRYLANREKKIAQAKAWAAANPERRREINLKGQKIYYDKNADALRAKARVQSARWRSENPEAARAHARAYDLRHPEKVKERQQRYAASPGGKCRKANRVAQRRARKIATQVECVDRQVVWERDEGICGICHLPADRADFHVDHVIPLSKGGPHTYENVQVGHPHCNLLKGAR